MIDVAAILISCLMTIYVVIRAVMMDRQKTWFPERDEREMR